MADQPQPRLAFWIHQLVEYLLGILLISQAIQSEHPEVPVALGVGVILLAATADGPLAAFHVVPRPLHRVLDVVAIVAIAVATIVFRDDLGTVGVVFAAAVVVAMAGLVVRTSYAPRRSKQRRAGPAPASPPPPATVAPAPAPPPVAVDPATVAPAPVPSPPAPPPVAAPAPVPAPPAPAPAPVPAPPAPAAPATAGSTKRSKGEVYSRAAGRALGKGISTYRGSKAAPPPPDPLPEPEAAESAPRRADGPVDPPPPPLPPPSPAAAPTPRDG